MKLLLILLLITSCRRGTSPLKSITPCKEGEILSTSGKEFKCVKKEVVNEKLF
jgi:hypothetical protein